jgi:hypothetical protein
MTDSLRVRVLRAWANGAKQMLGVGSHFVGPNRPPAKSQLRLGVELDRILPGAGFFNFLALPRKASLLATKLS